MKQVSNENKKVILGSELDFASREAYNLLRTNISFAFPDEDCGHAMGVSSACPSEGKSTVTINFAYSIAESGKKVLLIDGDMRRPSICAKLDLEEVNGLSEKLAGKSDVELYKGILHENLDILSAGHIPPNPSELIGSRRMEALITEYKNIYDYVIVDLPPVMAVSDPVAISKYLGGLILVVRHEKTRRRDLKDTLRQLEYANVKILGFVYKKISEKSHSKKSRNKYYYAEKKN